MAKKIVVAVKRGPAKKSAANLALGSLKGSMNAAGRRARMDSYLDSATGSSSSTSKKRK